MSKEKHLRRPIVMIVEDDPVDLQAVRRGFKSRDLDFATHAISDGQQALDLLRGGKFTGEQRERLIVFLDINMPGMNGHQFLEELRRDPELKRTIVFVLTTSDHEVDKAKAYDKNVAGYFVKSNLDGMLNTVAEYVQNVEFPPSRVTTR